MGVATPLLELRDVTHRFGGTTALAGAGITVRAGTVHALLGENGAGKTTLMRIAFGMIAPQHGHIVLDGEQVTLGAPADAIARGIGMVHQHFTLVPAMTAVENVALGGHGRLDMKRVAAELAALSAGSGLPVDPWARAGSLSIAGQQRLEILKALHRRARVLVLDEPTAVLAPAESDELLRWLRRYVAQGNAAVLITHKLAEALSVADEVTVLRHGRVTAHQTAGELSMAELTRAMLGEGSVAPVGADVLPAPVARAATGSTASTVPVARLVSASAHAGREQVRDVSLSVRAGEVLGVAAVEGSGHHALLRLIAGRIPPDEGTAEIPADVGFVPEDRLGDALLAEDDLAANVALRGAGSRRGRMQWRAWRARAAALITANDVRGAQAGSATLAGSLSGGNQQKLVVGRELEDAPSIVVAVNPARGLDVLAAATVLSRLRRAADAGAGVVIHSADLDELLAVADRMLVVHDGRVREVPLDRDAVGRAMLGIA